VGQTVSYDYEYYYDYANRLVRVTDGTSTIAEYDYGALGRRIMTDDQTTVTNFYYNGDQVYEEYISDTSETLEARYIYGNGNVDDVLIMMRTESTELDEYYYYHKNRLGSNVAVTDDTGDLEEQYSYDPFGTVYMKNGGGSSISTSAIDNPYLYTGRRYDEEIEKYYYRARHFDSVTGRFLQRDPMGYVDGMNLYEYCASNPQAFVDPIGLGLEKLYMECESGPYLDTHTFDEKFPDPDHNDDPQFGSSKADCLFKLEIRLMQQMYQGVASYYDCPTPCLLRLQIKEMSTEDFGKYCESWSNKVAIGPKPLFGDPDELWQCGYDCSKPGSSGKNGVSWEVVAWCTKEEPEWWEF
jgi:RHS repeat-associated protein